MQRATESVTWREVESSNVQAVGWDKDNHLYARFTSGAVYLYVGVSRQRAVACSRAKSVGRYFNKVIKPHYKAVKIG